MTNSEVSKAIKILDKEGKWHSLSVESLNGKYTINDILVTSNNDKWINISRPANQACLTVVTNSSSLDEATSYEFKTSLIQMVMTFLPIIILVWQRTKTDIYG